MTDGTLIFQHIPKTGGITLSHLLLSHFAREEVFHVRSPEHVRAPVLGGTWGSVEDFAALSEEERSRFHCVLGHMPFGIHQHIPGRSYYIVLLRDPIERILSQHGQYNKMVENDEIAGARTLSLEEYLREKPNTLDNHQTRFLIANSYHGKSDTERFNLVRTNLKERFRVVGILERFDESVLILNKVMGWRPIPYKRHNIGSLRSSQADVSAELLELMRKKNHLDFQVRAYGSDLLDKAIAGYGPTFGTDLAALRTLNKKFDPGRPSLASRVLGRLKRSVTRAE